MQLSLTPNWMNLIEAQNKLSLFFVAYLSAAEHKYIWHKINDSWMYKVSETSSIPKKSHSEVTNDTIAMPAIQREQLANANKLSQNSNTTNGKKRTPISQGYPKKKEKSVKFNKTHHPTSTPVKPKYYDNPKSPFTTLQSWNYFRFGKCPNHGKSEYGYTVSSENWYWCKICKKYMRDHNSSSHANWEASKNSYKTKQAAAKAVSPRAPQIPAIENVASAPAAPPQTQEPPDEEIPVDPD